MSTLSRLLGSRKAVVTMLTLLVAGAALLLGRATWDQFDGFARWIVMAWLGGQSLEDAAKHVAEAKRPCPPTATP